MQPVRFKQDPKRYVYGDQLSPEDQRSFIFTRGPSLFLLKTTLVIATGYFILEYLDLDLDDGEKEKEKAALAKKKPEGGNIEGGDEEEEAESEVEIPDELPEDALFIPVGLTRQRPQEYYQGTDPEWQSFIEFRKDSGREKIIRSMCAEATMLLVLNSI